MHERPEGEALGEGVALVEAIEIVAEAAPVAPEPLPEIDPELYVA